MEQNHMLASSEAHTANRLPPADSPSMASAKHNLSNSARSPPFSSSSSPRNDFDNALSFPSSTDRLMLPPISHISSPPSYAQAVNLSQPPVPLGEAESVRSPQYNGRSLPPLTNFPPKPDHSPASSTRADSLNGMLTRQPPVPPQWASLVTAPVNAYHPAGQHSAASPRATETDSDGNLNGNGIFNAASPGRAGIVNLDDPDVRLAAEALGDLRADFLSSPPASTATLPLSPAPLPPAFTTQETSARDEPLISLLTTSHPLLRTTIGGATSAYGGAKEYSARFKSGAEYVEGYLGPIANTVGNVSRVTGVEGSVRWFLGGNRRANSNSNNDKEGSSKKKRRVDEDQAVGVHRLESEDWSGARTSFASDSSPATPKGDRRLSLASTVDTLPAYDEMRSPAYAETEEARPPSQAARANLAWQTRLLTTTSGLSVAMSDESLRSLKYCLTWLKWANTHMAGAMNALKTTLDQYDNAGNAQEALRLEQAAQQEEGEVRMAAESNANANPQSRRELAARLDTLKGDVLKTLQDVISTVSKYAGGALPENAKILVRRHLTSLPARFRVAAMAEASSGSNPADNERSTREGAQKMLVLAKEGLDMVTQISGVLDGTIVSAEAWCERVGRKRKPGDDEAGPVLPQANEDVHMGEPSQ